MAHFTRTPVAERKITFDEIEEKWNLSYIEAGEYDAFWSDLVEAAGLTGSPIVEDLIHEVFVPTFMGEEDYRGEFLAMRCLSNTLMLIEKAQD